MAEAPEQAPEIIDFTVPDWGHAMHSMTFHPEPEEGDRAYSCMVHSQVYPRKGMHIKYKSRDGERVAEISAVEPMGDPPDMFTLHFFVISEEE